MYGNPKLALVADHVIGGYEEVGVRQRATRGYQKRYHGLAAVTTSLTWWRADGTGYARGVRSCRAPTSKLQRLVSYGWIDSRRRARPIHPFRSVRATPCRVGRRRVRARLPLAHRHALVARERASAHADRRRDFRRGLERGTPSWREPVRAHPPTTAWTCGSRGCSRSRGNICVAYAECMNILGTANVCSIIFYNADYTRRTANRFRTSQPPPPIVAGFAVVVERALANANSSGAGGRRAARARPRARRLTSRRRVPRSSARPARRTRPKGK